MTTATVRQKQKIADLFVDHYDFLFRAAKAILRRKADAYDVVQGLYLKRCVQRTRERQSPRHRSELFIAAHFEHRSWSAAVLMAAPPVNPLIPGFEPNNMASPLQRVR